MSPGRLSPLGAATTRTSCRTLFTTSYPAGKKDKFKAIGVKKDVPRIEMVHHQDMTLELSACLLAAQREIETLCIQLRNSDTTIRGCMRMVEGQASDLYTSDMDT
jgi:hypothetical protein